MPSRRPTSVSLTPEIAAALRRIGRPAASRVRAALADPGRLDLSQRTRPERWSLRLSEAEIAAADAIATEHGLSRDDLIARACEAVAGVHMHAIAMTAAAAARLSDVELDGLDLSDDDVVVVTHPGHVYVEGGGPLDQYSADDPAPWADSLWADALAAMESGDAWDADD